MSSKPRKKTTEEIVEGQDPLACFQLLDHDVPGPTDATADGRSPTPEAAEAGPDALQAAPAATAVLPAASLSPVLFTVRRSIEIPLARYSIDDPLLVAHRYQHIEAGRLTSDQRIGLRRFFEGLQAAGTRLDSGKPIATTADALRWLFEQLAVDDLPPAAEASAAAA